MISSVQRLRALSGIAAVDGERARTWIYLVRECSLRGLCRLRVGRLLGRDMVGGSIVFFCVSESELARLVEMTMGLKMEVRHLCCPIAILDTSCLCCQVIIY